VLVQEALGEQQRIKDTACMAASQRYLGLLALEKGDAAGALERLGESLTLYTEVGHQSRIIMAQICLGHARFAAGSIRDAEVAYIAGLQLERGLGNKQRTAAGLEGLAEVALAQGHPERAARFLGAAAAALASVGAVPLPLPPRLRAEREQVAARTQEWLTEAVYQAAFASGKALPLDEALAEALTSPP
jgi:hypothetical protein